MDRRLFIKSTLATSIAYALPVSFTPAFGQTSSSAIPLNISLPGPGRLGFYLDYSELDAVGTHTFYVCRTHGTTGAVSCTYTAYDDNGAIPGASGSLIWSDGSAEVKAISVPITNKPAGDHRCWVILSAATGGAALHHTTTIAYGVIDDDTIATSNALFIDADFGNDSSGDGSQANPYKTWSKVNDNLSSTTKYVYIKGQLKPDNTWQVGVPGADSNNMHLRLSSAFDGRTKESDRLIIRSWPGFTGGLDGNGQTRVSGFYAENTGSYVTYRKLNFSRLNTSSLSSIGSCFGLHTKQQVHFVTMELCDFNDIVTGASAVSAIWFNDQGEQFGHKMWRCSIDNAYHSTPSEPMNVWESYYAADASIQRCSLGAVCGNIYEKTATQTGIGISVRFCDMMHSSIRLSSQGSNVPSDYHIIQGNLFNSTRHKSTYSPIVMDYWASNGSGADNHWIVGNVFYNYDHNVQGTITITSSTYAQTAVFNNIFLNTSKAWVCEYQKGASPSYADYNHVWNNGSDVEWYVNDTTYKNVGAIKQTGWETNSQQSDPLFTDIAKNDWTLQANSPAKSSGVGGSEKGIYLGGFEILGATGMIGSLQALKAPPNPPNTINTQIMASPA